MYKIHKTQLTNHSLHSYSDNNNICPYCQGRNQSNKSYSPPSHQFNQSNNQFLLSNGHQNVYTNPMLMTFAPNANRFNSSAIFSNTNPISPNKLNKSIVFNYISPPKQRRNNSAQAKFNTKQFKNTKFPFIGIDQKNKDQRNISKNYVITDEIAPQKPKILKLNKIKSLQRMKLSSQNGSRSINHNNHTLQQKQQYKQNKQSNNKTPINILKNHLHDSYIPIPYSHNQQKSSKKLLQYKQQKPQLYVYQNLPKKGSSTYLYNQKQISSIQKGDYMDKLQQVQSDYVQKQIALSITDQLQLNYDYYYPIQDSDRSISLNIEL